METSKIIHRANSRGSADHGWLKVNHSFSFANWHDPQKMNFGALRVLNDDTIAPNMGFGTHPHDNMEIITIPLTGELAHKDSMGNSSTIKAGEIQVMSAGEGILHSESNPSLENSTNLFQIWIFPNVKNVQPRYDQFWMDVEKMKNNFLQVVSPNPEDEGAYIHQNAWIHLAELEPEKALSYKMHSPENGIYTMVIDGEISIADEKLNKRDSIGVWNKNTIDFKAIKTSKVLVIEVPMKF
ncbi:MAG: pirin family protein [Bacteroidetes bacterium]|nr:pirin family protein [Bacteroidota bacterium]